MTMSVVQKNRRTMFIYIASKKFKGQNQCFTVLGPNLSQLITSSIMESTCSLKRQSTKQTGGDSRPTINSNTCNIRQKQFTLRLKNNLEKKNHQALEHN